jgi:hypothetical protein
MHFYSGPPMHLLSGVDIRIDRSREGKKLSNEEWVSKTDPEAKIARLKDGRDRGGMRRTWLRGREMSTSAIWSTLPGTTSAFRCGC